MTIIEFFIYLLLILTPFVLVLLFRFVRIKYFYIQWSILVEKFIYFKINESRHMRGEPEVSKASWIKSTLGNFWDNFIFIWQWSFFSFIKNDFIYNDIVKTSQSPSFEEKVGDGRLYYRDWLEAQERNKQIETIKNSKLMAEWNESIR